MNTHFRHHTCKTKIFKNIPSVLSNPFYVYAYTNLAVILLYNFNFTYLFPSLSFELFIFIYLTILISLLAGFFLSHSQLIVNYNSIPVTHRTAFVLSFLISLIAIEFIYNGGVPIFLYFEKSDYLYTTFGIKTLHVFVVTFASFYTVYLFHLYISTKSNFILVQLILLLAYPILLMNRGAFVADIVSIFFVYIMSLHHIKLKVVFRVLLIFMIILFIFGKLGNIRSGSTNYFTRLSEPTPTFLKSGIPKIFLWAYIYTESPMGNLQETINNRTHYNLSSFILSSMTPDFISKHIAKTAHISQIAPYLTVGGYYAKGYATEGWLGMFILYVYLFIIIILYLIFLPKRSPFRITGYSVLLTIIFLNLFNNMIVFSGLSIQLLYPFLLQYTFVKREKTK